MVDLRETKRLSEWRMQLGDLCEALVDEFHTDPNEKLSAAEVLDIIIAWRKRVTGGKEIRDLLGIIYGADRLKAAMRSDAMSLHEWEQILNPHEFRPLQSKIQLKDPDGELRYRYPGMADKLTPDEVFDAIASWDGGYIWGYSIQSICRRVYQVML